MSGATIRFEGGTVCKFSSQPKLWERLNEQATYMAECGPPFVEILGIAHGRYWMKRYATIGIHDLPVQLLKAKESLVPLWDTENPRFIDEANWMRVHTARVKELCVMNDMHAAIHPLGVMFEEVCDIRHSLTVCAATHGDATLSNVVLEDEKFRWIDAIPPSLWLPAYKAVDLGKLLQSANGWEYFMANRMPPSRAARSVLEGETQADVTAAHYFHALCYLRMLRYCKDKQSVYDYAIGKLYDCIA